VTDWLSESMRFRLIVGRECLYCGAPATEVDHIRPRSLGGTNDESNLTGCCHFCNISKGNRLITRWGDLAKVLRGVATEPKIYAELCALANEGTWFPTPYRRRGRYSSHWAGRLVIPPRRQVPAPDAGPGHIVGRRDAATYLGMKPETFRKARQGRPINGEYRLADGRPAWPREALDRWAESRKRAGGPSAA
jgi:hypothetical protein